MFITLLDKNLLNPLPIVFTRLLIYLIPSNTLKVLIVFFIYNFVSHNLFFKFLLKNYFFKQVVYNRSDYTELLTGFLFNSCLVICFNYKDYKKQRGMSLVIL